MGLSGLWGSGAVVRPLYMHFSVCYKGWLDSNKIINYIYITISWHHFSCLRRRLLRLHARIFNEIRTVLNVDGNCSIGASLIEYSRETLCCSGRFECGTAQEKYRYKLRDKVKKRQATTVVQSERRLREAVRQTWLSEVKLVHRIVISNAWECRRQLASVSSDRPTISDDRVTVYQRWWSMTSTRTDR